jgi:hypothetical protein
MLIGGHYFLIMDLYLAEGEGGRATAAALDAYEGHRRTHPVS